MSRRKTKPEEIQNPIHYFNRYIAGEIRKDRERQREYNRFFCSLDEKLEKGEFRRNRKNVSYFIANEDGCDLEKRLLEHRLYAWIDQIEVPQLYEVISKLSEQERFLLACRYQLCLTQEETAAMMNCTQSTVSRLESRLLRIIRKALKKK